MAAGELLAALGRVTESRRGGSIFAAAASYARAARPPYRGQPPSSDRSRALRTAAGALLDIRCVARGDTRQLLALLARLAALAHALEQLRQAQGRAAHTPPAAPPQGSWPLSTTGGQQQPDPL